MAPSPDQFLRTSVPTDDSQGWQAVMTYTGSDSWETFKPYAVCIPRADVTDYQVKISDPVNKANGQSDTAGSPYCGPARSRSAPG